jgi:hypothetical protein
MAQPLAPESVSVLGVEVLDRDDTVDPRVTRLPHFPHAASAQGADDFVGAETSARSQSQMLLIIRAGVAAARSRSAKLSTARKTREPGRSLRGRAKFTL